SLRTNPKTSANPKANSSRPIVVTNKAGFALTVWLQKPNQGCSQAGRPWPASATIWDNESGRPGWNLRPPSIIQTKPKITRTAVFREPACCTNQLSRETWIDAIDVSPRRQPVRRYLRAWHIQNLLAEAGWGSQLC